MRNPSILVIGAAGQLGTVLTQRLQEIHGKFNVIASDLRPNDTFDGLYEVLDATQFEDLAQIVVKYEIREIYHMAAILSAKGEENPMQTWDLNMKTLFNVLEVSRMYQIEKVFFPSSIAVFGDHAPTVHTPQNTFLNPTTVYGMSKAAGENWGQYYFERYGVDVRSLRYPGVIGHQSLPGGGTTDYAVDIYHKAVVGETFTCFLGPESTLPMIYMEDAINATIQLMEAPIESIQLRTSYNISGMSFNPAEIAASIQKIYPEFKINYQPDHRQQIADSWPSSIDDSQARKDWNWKPQYDLDRMTTEMLEALKSKDLVKK